MDNIGIDCPQCHSQDIMVIDSRAHSGNSIRRRRKCVACNYRFTTFEYTQTNKDQYFEQLKKQIKKVNRSVKIFINLLEEVNKWLPEKDKL